MDPMTWIIVLTRIVAGELARRGKSEQASLLIDAATAAGKGKNVDDILAAAAEKWTATGAPSYEEIAAARKSIQERM